MSYNTSKVTVVGRIGGDAEEPRKVGDSQVTDFRVCANVYRGRDKDDTPVWYRVSCWGSFADIVYKQAKKGTLVYVSGDLVVEEYKKDGDTRYQLQILNPDVIFMDDGERPERSERRDRDDDRGRRREGESPFGSRRR